mgnify:CR=1 FL=1
MQLFQKALLEVPKSGEVWCEGARICLRRGDWRNAHKYLDFAILFTPQVGDISALLFFDQSDQSLFCVSIISREVDEIVLRFLFAQYGDSFVEFLRLELLEARENLVREDPSRAWRTGKMREGEGGGEVVQTAFALADLVEQANIEPIERLCVNVDPNYGAMWLRYFFPIVVGGR